MLVSRVYRHAPYPCVLAASLVAACGARSGLDLVADATAPVETGTDARLEATQAVDSAPTPDAAVACTAGYFIELGDDAGTVLRGGDDDADVPAKACAAAGEDCPSTTAIDGHDDAGSLWLIYAGCSSCPPLMVGTVSCSPLFRNASGTWIGNSTVDVTAIGPAAAMGDYYAAITLVYGADGGWIAGGGGSMTLQGAFCVRP